VEFLRFLRSATPETLLGGRYRLLGQLGVGGFGQTFLAEDLHLPDTPRCVLKRLQPQLTDAFNLQTAKRLFDTEARVLYQLGDHNQIPRLLAHFEHQQEFYLAQELVVGEPLSEELAGDQLWTETQAIAFLRDILGVLSFVHQQNVIHRDIKPANLIRRRHDSRIVLIDFGAVKQATTQLANPQSGPTQTIAIGTQGYMPNEQIVGNPRYSSDIYAAGMVAIQGLTGVSPRTLQEDHQTGEIQWQHLTPHISPELADVLNTMIRYDFRARYPTAKEALTAIASLPLPEFTPDTPPLPLSTPGTTDETLPHPSAADSTLPWKPAAAPPTAPPPTPPIASTPNISLLPTEPLLAAQPRPVAVNVPPTLLSNQQKPLAQRSKWILATVGVAAIGVAIALLRPTAPPQPATPSPSSPTASAPSPTPDANAETARLLAQANQLREQNQYQQALVLYDQALDLNASTPEAHWGRCYSLNGLKKPNEAIAACNAALKLNANYPEALWSKGYALETQQRYQDAIQLYDQAIKLNPKFAAVWNNKGTAMLRLNRPADAVAAFDQAIALDPSLAEAWNNRGAALWGLRRFQEAIASVDRALQLQPDYPDAQTLRQKMRQQLGQ
jgi:eukaryotic-like serine/threonine-protein kinase